MPSLYPGLLAIESLYYWLGHMLGDYHAAAAVYHTLIIAAAGTALWLGVIGVEKLRVLHRRRAQTPRALFQELCRAHRLSRQDRALLSRAALAIPGLKLPVLFVDPQVLRRLTNTEPAHASQYAALGSRLFGPVWDEPTTASECGTAI